MAAPASIRLQLIGPPGVTWGGAAVRLPTRKTLALLALLALADGAQRVPRAALARHLWSGLDDAAARRNLRRELHRLRDAGLAAALVDDGDTLALADHVDCDARHFRQAWAARDHARAAALGPGPLLDGMDLAQADGFDDWLLDQRQRHAGQWCDAAQAQASALTDAGHLREALVLLVRMHATDPLREAGVRQAMQCHARLGEVHHALALYERFSAHLADELGLQPLPETRDLALRLRAGATEAAPAPSHRAVEGPLPARIPFVGREAEIRTMEAAWTHQKVIVITGDAGHGKTRLACDFSAAHGAFALVACRPADTGIPYASAVRALRLLLAGAPGGVLPDWVRQELARLLPELGVPPPALQSAEERARFVAAIAAAWRTLLSDNFSAVVIDDWQHADAASADLFVHLAQQDADVQAHGLEAPARLLVVSRPTGPDAPAAGALARLREAGLVRDIELAALGAAEMLLLIQHLSGSAGASLFAQRLHRATGGNPLFVIETLRHLFDVGLLRIDAQGGWETPFDDATQDYRELPIPASVRQAVLGRARGLGEAALRQLEAASLAGDPFTLDRLEGTTALTEFERVAAVDAAVGARLLVAEGTDAYRFAHDLVAQALADSLSPERARLLSRRLALTAERLGLPAARVADHLDAAGELAAAQPWRLRAADAAERAFAHAEALAQLTRALPVTTEPAARIALQLRRAGLASLVLDTATVDAALDDALAVCGADRPEHHRVQIARAQACLASDRVGDALALLAGVIADAAATADDRAQALLARAAAHQKRGDPRGEADLEAVVGLLPAGPSALRARAWTGLGNLAMRHGDMARAGSSFAAAAHEFDAVGDSAGRANALWREGASRTLRGDLAGAVDLLERGLAEAERARHIGHQRGAILNLVKVLTQTGELERTAALLERGMTLSPAFSQPAEETAFRQSAYYVAYLRGELGQALRLAEAAIAHADGTAEVYWKVGARILVVDLALHLHDDALAARWMAEAERLEADHDLGYHRAPLAAKQAWLALGRGDAGAALARLDLIPSGAPSAEDTLVVEQVRARALLALGRVDEAWTTVQGEREASALDAWTLREATRLDVQRARGALDAPALAALDERDAQQALPPLEALSLAQALTAAWASLGDRRASDRARRRAEARRVRLAATLPEPLRAGWAQRT